MAAESGRCSDACTDGFYMLYHGSCASCASGCKNCNSYEIFNCTECDSSSTFHHINDTHKFCGVSTCESGFTPKDVSGVNTLFQCFPCVENCTSCVYTEDYFYYEHVKRCYLQGCPNSSQIYYNYTDYKTCVRSS